MIVRVPAVLSAEQLGAMRAVLADAPWGDGRVTAGYQSARVKENLQLPEDCEASRKLRDLVMTALERSPLFMAAALPARVFPPLFNRYDAGQTFGAHVDNAIRAVTGTAHRIRTDVSATLFLSAPDDYDGGELIVEDTYGAHSVKLPAGDMIVYPATSLHCVTPVTRGSRVAAFFWVQSMIKDDGQRSILFDLDRSIAELNQTIPDSPALVRLTACYHNLIRRWAEI
ncbi:MAG TPA: Fe2+-dependent dioxygenase [Rhizomicrobium sp.]|nr:Fe2+-dependent dioxygenase [Rhizomicrobium sp.]